MAHQILHGCLGITHDRGSRRLHEPDVAFFRPSNRLFPDALWRLRYTREQHLGQAIDKREQRLLRSANPEQFSPDLINRCDQSFFNTDQSALVTISTRSSRA